MVTFGHAQCRCLSNINATFIYVTFICHVHMPRSNATFIYSPAVLFRFTRASAFGSMQILIFQSTLASTCVVYQLWNVNMSDVIKASNRAGCERTLWRLGVSKPWTAGRSDSFNIGFIKKLDRYFPGRCFTWQNLVILLHPCLDRAV